MAGEAKEAGAAGGARSVTVDVAAFDEESIIAARGAAREMARELGFSVVDQVRIATAVTEIARNILMYARTGTIYIRECRAGTRVGLEVVAEDRGPGIPDVERVLQGGHSTSGSFGRGIAGARALMHEFHLESRPGEGTRVVMRRWRE
ncbi:MAG TPA: anti-sigma regulatory factor [Limnochordales bacterium]